MPACRRRVVDALPRLQLLIEGRDLQGALRDFIELLPMGALGPLDAAVEFGRAGGGSTNSFNPRCWQASSKTAANLPTAGRLTAAIDLQSSQREGQALLQGVEEAGGGAGGGSAVDLDHVPAADHSASRKVLEDHTRQRPQLQGIDLHQVPRLGDTVILGLTHGVGPPPATPVRADRPAGRFHQPTARFEVGSVTTSSRCFHQFQIRKSP